MDAIKRYADPLPDELGDDEKKGGPDLRHGDDAGVRLDRAEREVGRVDRLQRVDLEDALVLFGPPETVVARAATLLKLDSAAKSRPLPELAELCVALFEAGHHQIDGFVLTHRPDRLGP